ncbi:MAG: hypothetical protein LBL73_07125 [Synergistaceae bacterium]|jgi:hypothetical protein|nr:hypothetical protein [Synergistaceae bacterium]
MRAYAIPLTPTPQTFNISLANKEYLLTVRWNAAPEGGWWLDISRPDNGEPILHGLPVVTGTDLLGPFGYLDFGGSLVCYSGASDEAPTYENLGIGNDLLFVVSADG